jgi:hypothetical protein
MQGGARRTQPDTIPRMGRAVLAVLREVVCTINGKASVVNAKLQMQL